MRKPTFWFTNGSDTNQAVKPQNMTRGLKFRIWKEEGLYYPCSENKGADQLSGITADLRPCFHICKMLVSHDATHFYYSASGELRRQSTFAIVQISLYRFGSQMIKQFALMSGLIVKRTGFLRRNFQENKNGYLDLSFSDRYYIFLHGVQKNDFSFWYAVHA